MGKSLRKIKFYLVHILRKILFSLPLGVNNVVILNDFEAAKDMLNKEAFLGRPHYSAFNAAANVRGVNQLN